jgi:hypothetical protein
MHKERRISTYPGQSFTAEEIAAIEQKLWGKAGVGQSRRVVHLEGLWQDIPLDVSTENISQVRQELSEALKHRTERL